MIQRQIGIAESDIESPSTPMDAEGIGPVDRDIHSAPRLSR
jgi:hypothetical protein